MTGAARRGAGAAAAPGSARRPASAALRPAVGWTASAPVVPTWPGHGRAHPKTGANP